MATIDLAEHFLQATEAAAVAASAWRGLGDRKAADGAAVEAMRTVFDSVPFDGRVAIGEGERDDAPMLWTVSLWARCKALPGHRRLT